LLHIFAALHKGNCDSGAGLAGVCCFGTTLTGESGKPVQWLATPLARLKANRQSIDISKPC
jgi:hypothetical protein